MSSGPWIIAAACEGECAGCWDRIKHGDTIRTDGDGGWLCEECGDDGGMIDKKLRPRIEAIGENLLALRGGRRDAIRVNLVCLAEEVGEALKETRRYLGDARRASNLEMVAAEFADVVIATEVTAWLLGIDLDTAVRRKLSVIRDRGGV